MPVTGRMISSFNQASWITAKINQGKKKNWIASHISAHTAALELSLILHFLPPVLSLGYKSATFNTASLRSKSLSWCEQMPIHHSASTVPANYGFGLKLIPGLHRGWKRVFGLPNCCYISTGNKITQPVSKSVKESDICLHIYVRIV